MAVYVFDGSFDGLLTVIYHAFKEQSEPTAIYTKADFNGDLFSQVIEVNTDSEKASKVFNGIINKNSREILQRIYYLFLSEVEGSYLVIYRYLKKLGKLGKEYDQNLQDETIRLAHKISQTVSRERHRMLGLARFQCLGEDIYYAKIEPEHDIVELLAPHFAKRLSNQVWCIHDLKREKAVMYNNGEWVTTTFSKDMQIKGHTSSEQLYEQLWQKHFKHIAIKNKINPKLQMQKMPKKYWQHLTEKTTF
ncbi:TIGR03915 family putative DNA repair protein [Desulfuribacillus alkaliarsenatis]|uniref:DUF4130 domain-containing protein n=1 Tax=Desulfuribacillus alkaliarsenatis TaxID=766136 RepID=A0A1E5G1H7_9FIRM|nr:TIGR03915 family putative DNA repair protein [Desulfuribacillus alkaliarsenatis]OEF96298.1 hypothetical protein BHF68_09050 [Desulfuribacillus alkaliarsenatis]